MDNLLALFNIASLITFVVLTTLGTLSMARRIIAFRHYGIPIPALLKRGMVLFGAFEIYFGSVLVALVTNATGLGHEVLWIVPRGLMVLGAMAYWVWIEYHLESNEHA